MDAKAIEVGLVLNPRQIFLVPLYQRRFAWHEDRLEPLWNDIVAKATELIAGKSRRYAHYMGALIVLPKPYEIIRVQPLYVVDGQQRITTFQLFLAAVRDLANEFGLTDMAEQLRAHLFNGDEMLMQDPKTERYKVHPTAFDRPLFRDLVDLNLDAIRSKYGEYFFQNQNLRKGDTPLLLRAWWFFRLKAYAFAVEEGSEIPGVAARLGALWRALLREFRLVFIALDEDDDAQVIFETLNSRGQPLTAMDLVRNDIFHRAVAGGEDAESLILEKWASFEDGFWQETQGRGFQRRPRIDVFLGNMLIAETGEEIATGELYSEYRSFIRPKKGEPRFGTVAAELDRLILHAPTFRALAVPTGTTALASLGRKLNVWEVNTAYPLVMRIEADTSTSETSKAALYRMIYAYIVRRAFCGLTTRSLGLAFLRVIKSIMERGVSTEAFVNAFADQTSAAYRVPANDEFRRAIVERPIYGPLRSERLRLVLEDLELALRDKFDEDITLPGGLTVEHILPDTWATHWPLSDGRKAPSSLEADGDDVLRGLIDARESAKHTLGNLTLVTGANNPGLSNLDFATKRPRLEKSLLKLNQEITKLNVWNEESITARGERLAALAIEIWPATEPNI